MWFPGLWPPVGARCCPFRGDQSPPKPEWAAMTPWGPRGAVTASTHGCRGGPQVLQAGRFSAVWRGTLQQRPVAIKAFAAGAAGRFAAERAVHALPLMEHENVARLLHTRGTGPRARGGLLVLQLYPAVSGSGGPGRRGGVRG